MGDPPDSVTPDMKLSEFEESTVVEVAETAATGGSSVPGGRGWDIRHVAVRDPMYGWIALDLDRPGILESLLGPEVGEGDRFRVDVDDTGSVESVQPL